MTRGARPRLRTRLIAWYAGTLCCVLLTAAAAVRYVVGRAMEQAHEESIAASADLFREFFRVEIAEYRTVEATLAHIARELVFEDRAIDVHRPDGTVFTPPDAELAAAPPLRLRAPFRDRSFALDAQLAPGWRIDVHSSAATLAAARRRIDLWLLGGIPFVVVVATVLGWWLAGRALRPIGRMAAEARSLDVRAGSRLTLDDPSDELGRFGASFNAVLDRLDGALAQQRRFLADAAHELRSPLARLRSRAELGRVALPAASPASQALLEVEREVRAASDMVDGLLALARAEAGALSLSLHDGFVDDVVADELPRWRESAALAGVTVELGDFEEVRARFDQTLVRRLVGLLLDNAIHYSPAGGVVTVHVRRAGEAVRLAVEDRGIGIPAAEREAVFARFYRTADARARRGDGSGIGLSLAQWIVAQHQGRISAEDRADGATGVALVAEWPVEPPVAAVPSRDEGALAPAVEAARPEGLRPEGLRPEGLRPEGSRPVSSPTGGGPPLRVHPTR